MAGDKRIETFGGIEEFGRPRKTHNLEIAGSNPAPATEGLNT
jgi:hypothetical protein